MSSTPVYPSTNAFQGSYKSTHKRAQIVRLLLIIGAALNGAGLCFFILHYLSPGTTITEDTTDPITIILALMEGGIALMGVGVFIATIVFFLMWMYRSIENLPAFGPGRGPSAYSSGWAVGSWFIPFVSLVVPYQATKELWNKSVPNTGSFFSSLSPPVFFPVWWLFWLLSNFVSNAYFRLTWNEQLAPETDALVGAVSSILNIVAALLAMKVVKEIDTQQTESAKLIGQEATTAAPPLPEMFRSPTVHPQTGA